MIYYQGPKDMDPITAWKSIDWRQVTQIAVDTETINLKDRTCLGIGICHDQDRFYIPTYPISQYVPQAMYLLENPAINKIYFNCTFDLDVLENLAKSEPGLPMPDATNISDASIMAQVMGIPLSLENLSQELLNEHNPFSIRLMLLDAESNSMLDILPEDLAEKCMWDIYYTWRCWEELNDRILTRQKDCYDVDIQLIPILRTIQHKGLALNKQVITNHQSTLQEEVDHLHAICQNLGFNPGSPKQVGEFLAFRGNNLPVGSKLNPASTTIRTDADTLELLTDPVAKLVLRYREKKKLLSTYVVPWIGLDRAYT